MYTEQTSAVVAVAGLSYDFALYKRAGGPITFLNLVK